MKAHYFLKIVDRFQKMWFKALVSTLLLLFVVCGIRIALYEVLPTMHQARFKSCRIDSFVIERASLREALDALMVRAARQDHWFSHLDVFIHEEVWALRAASISMSTQNASAFDILKAIQRQTETQSMFDDIGLVIDNSYQGWHGCLYRQNRDPIVYMWERLKWSLLPKKWGEWRIGPLPNR